MFLMIIEDVNVDRDKDSDEDENDDESDDDQDGGNEDGDVEKEDEPKIGPPTGKKNTIPPSKKSPHQGRRPIIPAIPQTLYKMQES